MITLYEFPPAFGMTNASPFAMKLQAYCKLANIDYNVKYRLDSNKMPKKKLPVAVINGDMIADSNIILAQLEREHKLDSDLTKEQHALGFLIKELAEEKLYWCLVYSRWSDDEFWPESKRELFGEVPFLLQWLIPGMVQKGLKKALYAQGLGRHSKQEIYQFATEAITQLSNLLGEKEYFVTDRMTQYDCALYAVLANLYSGGLNTPIKRAIASKPNLVNYIKQCKKKTGI